MPAWTGTPWCRTAACSCKAAGTPAQAVCWALPQVLQRSYLENVPAIVPALEKEYRHAAVRLDTTRSELSDLQHDRLRVWLGGWFRGARRTCLWVGFERKAPAPAGRAGSAAQEAVARLVFVGSGMRLFNGFDDWRLSHHRTRAASCASCSSPTFSCCSRAPWPRQRSALGRHWPTSTCAAVNRVAMRPQRGARFKRCFVTARPSLGVHLGALTVTRCQAVAQKRMALSTPPLPPLLPAPIVCPAPPLQAHLWGPPGSSCRCRRRWPMSTCGCLAAPSFTARWPNSAWRWGRCGLARTRKRLVHLCAPYGFSTAQRKPSHPGGTPQLTALHVLAMPWPHRWRR